MKQITILLSSVLTLLLITSNNASYAYELKNVQFEGSKFQGKKPNMNSGGRFMPKPNRLGKGKYWQVDETNILKKGNVFRGNVRMLPNRNSGGRFNPISKYSISDEPSFIPKPNRGSYTDSGRVTYIRSGKDGFIGQARKAGFRDPAGHILWNVKGQEGGVFDDTQHEDGIIDGTSNTVSPINTNTGKGVQLEFINGKWVERDRSTGATRRRGDVVYDENGKDGFIVQTGKDGLHNNGAFRLGKAGYTECDEKGGVRAEDCPKGGFQAGKDRFIGEAGLIGENGKVGIFVQDVGPEGKDGFIVQTGKDGALGPDVVTTLEHGPVNVNDNDSRITFPDDLGPPGIVSGTGAGALQQPKGVPLKFINGEWVEDQSLKPYAWP